MNKICVKKTHLFLIIIIVFFIGLVSIIKSLNSKNFSYDTKADTVKSPNNIVGGQPAQSGEWPFTVFLYDKKFLDSHHFEIPSFSDITYITQDAIGGADCAGTLIDKRWVLTAAHCLYNYNVSIDQKKSIESIKKPEDMGIAVGFNDTHENILETEWNNRFLDVEAFYQYGDFAYSISHGLDFQDIALIKLKSNANYPTISLTNQFDLTLPGKKVCAIGWGTTSTNIFNVAFSRYLNKVSLNISNLPVNSNSSSSIKYYHQYFMSVNDPGGKSTCEGDSGGPALTHDQNNKKWLQVGIISAGNQKCTIGQFTNVTAYTTWIEQITGIKINMGTFSNNPNCF